MAELQDYLMSPTSLADYMPEEILGSISNEKTKTNLAANIATLSQDPVATFGSVKTELDVGARSSTHQSIMSRIDQEGQTAKRNMFMEMFLDENTSDEDKLAMAQQLASDTIPVQNEQDVISEQALLQGDGVLTDEGFVTRDSAIGIFRDANRLREETQKLQNAQKTFSDERWYNQVADLGELFVPFLEQGVVESLRADLEEAGIEVDGSNAFVLLGSSKKALAEAIQKMPVQQRMELLTKTTELIKSNDSVVFDSNTLILADLMQTVLVDGSYSTTDEWIDNVIGALDWIGVGSTAKSLGKFKRAKKAVDGSVAAKADIVEDADGIVSLDEGPKPKSVKDAPIIDVDYEDVTSKSVQTEVIRISPQENINRNNTGKGRAIHEAVIADKTGQLAEAVSGASRVESVANNLLPQVRKVSGGVDYKLPTPNYTKDIEARGPNPRTVLNSDTEAGRMYYYNSEKIKEQTLTLNDFENAVGLTSRPNLTSFEARSDGIDVGVTYGPLNHGYANANDAVELVKYHLRDYGVKDENLTVLRNTPKGYEPVALSPNMPIGDYLVRVDYKHRFSAKKGQVTGKRSDTMIEEVPEKSFITDLFEAFGPTGGGVRSYIFSAESVLDQRLMGGAFTAIDEAVGIEKQLIDLVRSFSKDFRGLKKARKEIFVRAVQEANNLGIHYSRTFQAKWGMTDKEYDILKKFKTVQDQLYWLENEDFVRSLKNRGYGEWTDGKGTKLIARPIARQQAKGGTRVLDPSTNQVSVLTDADLTKLYANNGVIAQLRTKFDLNGELVEYILSKEKMDSGYFRSLTTDDAVLSYRPGYYKVEYKDPLFIIEELSDGTYRTVATAPDTATANLFVKRMQNSNPGRSFFHRPDLKKMDFDNTDAQFDVSVAQGRSAQRYRGLRLQDSTQLGQPLQASNIADPIEAFQHAATSIASRMSMRDYLEAYKVRLVNSYKDVMPIVDGQPVFPDNVEQIKNRKTGRNTRRVRQARGLYRYVDMLESTSGSNLGRFTQAGLNSLADVVGNIEVRGSAPLERALREMAKKDPVAASAKTAFITQIATDPLGQLITQSGGVFMSFGRNPKFFLREGGFMEQTWAMWAHRAGVKITDDQLKRMNFSRKEWDELMFRLEQSGLPYAADVNNLMRSGAESMSEADWAALRGPMVNLPQRTVKALSLGFDMGEFFNITSAYLTLADEARKAGKLNNAEDYQRLAAETRNFTFGMNKAGQFGYQTNELRIPLQYFQVVQKMFQLITTNKSITKTQKAKLFGAVFLMFGLGIPGLKSAVDKITEDWAKDPMMFEAKEALEDGLVQYGVNAALSLVSGESQNIAVMERLNPLDYNGAQSTIVELISEHSWVELVTESPSGQTFSKIGRAMSDGLKLINLSDDNLPNNPTDLYTFVKSVGTIFSGTTNAFKAKLAWEYGKSFSAGGFVTDQETTSVEAIAKVFGFRTMDEARQFALSEDLYGTSKKEKAGWSSESDVEEWYKGVKRDLFLKGEDTSSQDAVKMIYGNVGHRLFSDHPTNLLILRKLIDRDRSRGDTQFIDGIMNAMKVGIGETEVKNMINRLPNVPREKKAELLEMIDNVEALKGGE
jgi:hypothetical protein